MGTIRFTLAVLIFGMVTGVWAAPITFNTALPVAQGDFILREQGIFMQADRDPTSANRNMTVSGAMSVLGYGITSDLTVFGMLPYLDKSMEMNQGGMNASMGSRDFGDPVLLLRDTVWQRNTQGSTFRISPFVGVKVPTASDSVQGGPMGGNLPMLLQPGSGSWDSLVGAVATYQTLSDEFDLSSTYRHNGTANGFRFGNTTEVDASWQHRLYPGLLNAGLPGFLYGVLEANWVSANQNWQAGAFDQNSGGGVLYLDPGIQYVTRIWVLEGAVQIPTAQNMNGQGLKAPIAATVGFRFNF